jgi:hypothetical protein
VAVCLFLSGRNPVDPRTQWSQRYHRAIGRLLVRVQPGERSEESLIRSNADQGFFCCTVMSTACQAPRDRQLSFECVCEDSDMSVESAPTSCPSGHALTGGTCLVGWEVCGCVTAENGGHRTHYCRKCGKTVRTPPCAGAMPQADRWRSR